MEHTDLLKRWVETWDLAGSDLQRIRREELRRLDTFHAIALLCGACRLYAALTHRKPWSGLVEQQHWFKSLHHHHE